MTDRKMLAADHIRELTQTHTTMTIITREDTDKQEIHRVTEIPLLDQLAHAVHGSTSLSDNDAAPGAFTSKPAAHLEAIDTLHRIDTQARDLAADHGLNPTGNLTTILHRISGAIGDKPHHKIHSWWAAARMVTHHDTPPHRPHGIPCPNCWDTNTLRIRLDEELATCTACGQAWDRTGEPHHGSLDVLAGHVKWCSEHEVTRTRHWTVTADGHPTECIECLAFREAWAEWRRAHPRDSAASPGRVA